MDLAPGVTTSIPCRSSPAWSTKRCASSADSVPGKYVRCGNELWTNCVGFISTHRGASDHSAAATYVPGGRLASRYSPRSSVSATPALSGPEPPGPGGGGGGDGMSAAIAEGAGGGGGGGTKPPGGRGVGGGVGVGRAVCA